MIVVGGAGAAGLCAAIFARSGQQAVTVVEVTRDGGRKILISGGGRCNVLPEKLEPQRFVTASPRPLVQRLLRSWPLQGQHAFFEQEVGVALDQVIRARSRAATTAPSPRPRRRCIHRWGRMLSGSQQSPHNLRPPGWTPSGQRIGPAHWS